MQGCSLKSVLVPQQHLQHPCHDVLPVQLHTAGVGVSQHRSRGSSLVQHELRMWLGDASVQVLWSGVGQGSPSPLWLQVISHFK